MEEYEMYWLHMWNIIDGLSTNIALWIQQIKYYRIKWVKNAENVKMKDLIYKLKSISVATWWLYFKKRSGALAR